VTETAFNESSDTTFSLVAPSLPSAIQGTEHQGTPLASVSVKVVQRDDDRRQSRRRKHVWSLF